MDRKKAVARKTKRDKSSAAPAPTLKYNLHWIALVPVSGRASKTDENIANKKLSKGFPVFRSQGYALLGMGGDKNTATKRAKELRGTLTRDYIAYIITDAQFGNASKSPENTIKILSNGMGVKLTSRQVDEAFVIQKK